MHETFYNNQKVLVFVYPGNDILKKSVTCIFRFLPFNPYILILTHQEQTAFENIVGKEEIARNEQFLLFPQCFLLHQEIVSPFVNIFDIMSLFAAELEEPKIGIQGKGLTNTYRKDYHGGDHETNHN